MHNNYLSMAIAFTNTVNTIDHVCLYQQSGCYTAASIQSTDAAYD